MIFDAVVKADFINFGVFAPLPCTVYLVNGYLSLYGKVGNGPQISSIQVFSRGLMTNKDVPVNSKKNRATERIAVSLETGSVTWPMQTGG